MPHNNNRSKGNLGSLFLFNSWIQIEKKRKQNVNDSSRAYLEGATPTKFGPRPLKRERGPSFSKINLWTE